jgi:uncharacterized damage-inducible protein DinB
MNSNANDYLQTAIKRLRYYKDLADKTFEQLDDAAFHFSPGQESNSIAVIIQHMAGNMLSRWTNFLTEDGEKPWRRRDDEFETQSFTRQQLLDTWEKGWKCFLDALLALDEADLSKTIYIRQEPLSVIDAINRQLAHYPYHVGQIVYIGRMQMGSKWKSLSIPKGGSDQYNQADGIKDPAKKM